MQPVLTEYLPTVVGDASITSKHSGHSAVPALLRSEVGLDTASSHSSGHEVLTAETDREDEKPDLISRKPASPLASIRVVTTNIDAAQPAVIAAEHGHVSQSFVQDLVTVPSQYLRTRNSNASVPVASTSPVRAKVTDTEAVPSAGLPTQPRFQARISMSTLGSGNTDSSFITASANTDTDVSSDVSALTDDPLTAMRQQPEAVRAAPHSIRIEDLPRQMPISSDVSSDVPAARVSAATSPQARAAPASAHRWLTSRSAQTLENQSHALRAAVIAAQNTQNEHARQEAQEAQARQDTYDAAAEATIAAHAALERVVLGTRVQEGHENFVTAYNMLTGIRVAVSRCNAKINRDLIESDFLAASELDFDLSGTAGAASAKHVFKFKDYAPWVFRHLRDLFRLDPADYLMSLTAKYIVSELGSPGKSGSFFYYSRDYRFIIKTIRHSEHKRLRKILKNYYYHVRQYPDTLISQFYGLHRVRLPFGRKIHFVVMNNVFPALYQIHRRYDLKGSTLGRSCEYDSPGKPVVVYKDLDWLRNHEKVFLGPEKRRQFIRQLEADVRMLEQTNVMDYSLLIGIHDMSQGNAALDTLLNFKEFGPNCENDAPAIIRGNRGNRAEFAELQRELEITNPRSLKTFDFSDNVRSDFMFYCDKGGFQATDIDNNDLDIIYYMGVIDFLTPYSLRKRLETFCKSMRYRRDDISAVPSAEYGERFLTFIRGSIEFVASNNNDTHESGINNAVDDDSRPLESRQHAQRARFAGDDNEIRRTREVCTRAQMRASRETAPPHGLTTLRKGNLSQAAL